MSELIGMQISINNKLWRVASKTFRYGREWQYTLSHEKIDGMYESMRIGEEAMKKIMESGGKVNISPIQEKLWSQLESAMEREELRKKGKL